MITGISFGKFMSGWLPALAVAAVVEPSPRLADAFMVSIGGLQVPPITCGLGLLGIALARPLARRRETALSWPAFILVSMIMLIVVQLWIVEQRPGALFAFVIAIGLGFSGFSLIELVGAELSGFVKRLVAIPTRRLGASAPGEESQTEDPPQ